MRLRAHHLAVSLLGLVLTTCDDEPAVPDCVRELRVATECWTGQGPCDAPEIGGYAAHVGRIDELAAGACSGSATIEGACESLSEGGVGRAALEDFHVSVAACMAAVERG